MKLQATSIARGRWTPARGRAVRVGPPPQVLRRVLPPVEQGVARAPATRSDGLRWKISGAEVKSLAGVGTVPGIAVLHVAGRNGPGIGILRLTGAGQLAAWRAPGSAVFGSTVRIASDGAYLVEDGEDLSKYLRIQVYRDFLPAGGEADSRVYIQDVYDNGLSSDEVSAAEATAGLVETVTLALANDGPNAARDVKIWLEMVEGFERLEISLDNVSFYRPWHEGHAQALSVATIAAGGSQAVYLRRTIGAGAAADPDILNVLRCAWDGY